MTRRKSDDEHDDEDPPENDPIIRNLRRVYNETAQEPLPEKLAELLERLRKKGKEQWRFPPN